MVYTFHDTEKVARLYVCYIDKVGNDTYFIYMLINLIVNGNIYQTRIFFPAYSCIFFHRREIVYIENGKCMYIDIFRGIYNLCQ